MTLGFFGIFSGKLSEKLRKEQYRENVEAWKLYNRGQKGRMLEHQRQLSAFSYGKTSRIFEKIFLKGRKLTAAENACEVIAVYNALCALGRKGEKDRNQRQNGEESFPELLEAFSAHGICANGLFGTAPGAIQKYFEERGYRVSRAVGKQITRERMEQMQAEAGVCILTSFNRGQDPFSMVHTMCVTKEEGGWRLHNDSEGGRTYPALYDAVIGYNGQKSHPIQVLGIVRKAHSG